MKTGIHPDYHTVNVTCACGATFTTGSTSPEIAIEVCSSCHPYFTGKQKIVDTAGRIDKFQQQQKAAATFRAKRSVGKKKTTTPDTADTEKPAEPPVVAA